ncbi:Uncharacterised protein [Yersinia pseudotuberculosis]|uniref:Uncharacterized protein n=1 Tax=Yersinia pseudotuberculosis TaxID=633 RepID=A0A380Q5C6_YERPU|nr:Uncharacterised protein [Yersinia pseudotuberculosis]
MSHQAYLTRVEKVIRATVTFPQEVQLQEQTELYTLGAHDSPEGARLILADDAFSAELVPALLARGIDLGSRQIYVAAIAPQPIGEKASTLASTWHQRWGGTPGCYFWETMAALQVASQYPDFPAQTLLGALNFDAQHESHPASFSLWLATHRGLQIVLTPEVSI